MVRLMRGWCKSEGWKRAQRSFLDALNAATPSGRTVDFTSDGEAEKFSKGKRKREKAERAKAHAEHLRMKKQAKKENKRKLQTPKKRKKK
jgi:hypothetical protein